MIGVIDSGLGGLHVVAALHRALPEADITYFGDTARAPYGTRGPERIARLTAAGARLARAQGAQVLVVAGHSMACAEPAAWRDALGIPVFDIAAACLEAAVQRTRSGRLGVIASPAAVESGRYGGWLAARAPRVRLTAVACPALPVLVEEGFAGRREAALLVKRCIRPLRQAQVDTVVLGSSYLVALRPVLQRKLGARVVVVDGAAELSAAVARRVAARRAAGEGAPPAAPRLRLTVSELTPRVRRSAGILLGRQADLEWLEAIAHDGRP
jgi:glutamate racemase